jgi:type IV pilus assembly protein PilM
VKINIESIRKLAQTLLPKFKVLFSKAKPGVGLDIGTHSVKVIEISDRTVPLELLKFGIEYFKESAPLESIKRALEKADVHSREVNISVSGPSTVVRYIYLPMMKKEEVSNAIKFEAEKHILFPIDEVILDWQLLNEEPQTNRIRILLVAAKKDFIEERVKLVEDAGLTPQLIDIDAFALINTFQVNVSLGAEETAVLLNIGAGKTCVDILKGNNLYFTRDIMIAGNEITNNLAEKSGLEFSKAEELKCNPGERSKEVLEKVQPVLEILVNELHLSFDYYESQFERSIDKVYLSGGSSNLQGLDGFLSQALGVEMQILNPVKLLQINPNLNQVELSKIVNQLGVATGLALKKI